MTVGLRKMPDEEWLRLDNAYVKEQHLCKDLPQNNRNGVLQYLRGTEEACEALECTIGFLTK